MIDDVPDHTPDFPDETPGEALARVERRQHAIARPEGLISLANGPIVPLTAGERETMLTVPLYIAFFNFSGTLPDPNWDFSGLEGITDEERRKMPRYAFRTAPNQRMLTDGTPMSVEKRIAVAPLVPRRVRFHPHSVPDGRTLLGCRVFFDKTTWVTHFAVGDRHAVLMAAAFNKAIPVVPGNGLKFSLSIEALQLDPRSLPQLDDGRPK